MFRSSTNSTIFFYAGGPRLFDVRFSNEFSIISYVFAALVYALKFTL
jgi:hypothetical protein